MTQAELNEKRGADDNFNQDVRKTRCAKVNGKKKPTTLHSGNYAEAGGTAVVEQKLADFGEVYDEFTFVPLTTLLRRPENRSRLPGPLLTEEAQVILVTTVLKLDVC